MLTQFQTTSQRAAFLAACARPRVQAGVVVSVAPWALSVSAIAPAAVGGSGFGSAAEVRPFAAERPAFGYAPRGAEKVGFAATATMPGLAASAGVGNGTDSVRQQDQKQNPLNHLTRREPRTWSPPR